MIKLKTVTIFLILITCMLREYLVCANNECTGIQNSCTNKDGDTVALCIHTRDKKDDYCHNSSGSDVFEFDSDCNPRNCPAILKIHCNPSICENGGTCVNLIGTYSCICKNDYHGRHCTEVSDGGKSYIKEFFFVYSPYVKVGQNSIIMFLKEPGDNMRVEFTVQNSGETFKIHESHFKQTSDALQSCLQNWYPSQEKFVSKNFCSSKFVPVGQTRYTMLYYDVVYSDEGPGVIKIYVSNLSNPEFPGFQENQLNLNVYNNDKLEFSNVYKQTSIYFGIKVCPVPVKFDNCGSSSEKPLQFTRRESKVIKSILRTHPDCKNPTSILTWNIYDYETTWFGKAKAKLSDSGEKWDKQNYKVNPFSLAVGLYKVKLSIKSTGTSYVPNFGVKTHNFTDGNVCFIKIMKLPLMAEIKGGTTRTVSVKTHTFEIDGSNSYDPNYPLDTQSHLKWGWTISDSTVSCSHSSGRLVCEIPQHLPVGTNITFTLKLSTSDESSPPETVSQAITLSALPQAQLEILCLKNCGVNSFKTNPNEVVYLKVNVLNNYDVKSFSWTYSMNGGLETSTEDIQQSTIDSRILVLKKNTLQLGSTYTFYVKVNIVESSEKFEGSTSIQLVINKPPKKGMCSISPKNGYKVITEFDVLCVNFTDDNDISQLFYEFYEMSSGDANLGMLLGVSVTGELKNIILTKSDITIRVYDIYGMYTDDSVRVGLQDWRPTEDDIRKMINNVSSLASFGDSAGSLRVAGAIIDVMDVVKNKHSVLNSVLDILRKANPNDFYDVKLFSSVLNKVVKKGVPELENGLNSEGAKFMGGMMVSLAQRFLLEVKAEDKKGSVIMADEINNITMTMLTSSDVIIKSKDESIFQTSTGSLKMFSTHQQYRVGTASMVRALAYTGVAVVTNLLPHEEETTLRSNDTMLWLKVESPDILANLSGIPANENTEVKVSKQLAKHLNSLSENIALEVMTFKNNPFWWDIQDRDVASEIASVRAWSTSSINMKAIEEIPEPIDIYLNIKNIKYEVLSGSVTASQPSDSDDIKDAAIAVHTLEAPEEDSNGKLYVEFQNLTEDSDFKVLISTNLRPDYDLMMEKSFVVNSKSPSISILYNNLAADTLHFIGIFIPPSNATKQSIQYTMKVYSVQCKVRLQTVWTSPACLVGEETTKDVVHCKCSHLTFFGSSIFVAPNSIHPIRDLRLFINLRDNPLVFSLVMVLLIFYVILLIWARLQEKKDKLMGQVIVLEDNYPGDEYPYLVAVYTAFNVGAATAATVGIELIGEEITSRVHILRSKVRKVFRRNADDWFLLFTPVHLGTLDAVHLWHDNSGSHPDWYCKKIKVYDMKDKKEYTFLVDQWLSIWPGEHIEVVTKAAKRRDEYDWRNVVIHNIVYNFQDKHLWLSIFLSHPRATVSKSQRLTMAFCIIMVTFLTSIMFYGIAKGNAIEDDNEYAIKAREIIIAIESAIISAIFTSLVITCFKRSQVIIPSMSSVEESQIGSEHEEAPQKNEIKQVDSKKRGFFLKCICNFLHSMVKSKPLMPILFGKESSESVLRRRRWAKAGWIISQIIIWGSGFFIILYGLKLGKVISELWVTSATICFVNGIFLSAPVKIIAFSTALAFFGEMYDVTTFECEIESAKKKGNYGDEDSLIYLLELRSLPIYRPLPEYKTQELKESAAQLNKRLHIFDLVATVLICLIVMNYAAHLQQDSGYFLNSHIESTLTNCLSTTCVGLNNALNVFRFTDYLIVTLLPNLYREKWYNKAALTSPDESLANMGWVSDATHRLVGVPQLRQIRIKAENCSFSKMFNVSNAKCLPSLSRTTEDTADYGLNWGPISKYVNKPLLLPFTYQQDSGDGSLMFGASGASYHSGGYTIRLDDTQRECNLVIADLIDNGWWNIHARVFITELTLFNPNTDSHSSITIITEHLPSGAFLNRIQVTTISLSFQFFNFGLFLLIVIVFNFRLIVSINRLGFFSAFLHTWRIYDIVLVGVCNLTAIFECFKIIRAATAVHIFQQVGNSNFFNFSNIVFYERVSLFLWCLVLFLAPIRVLKFKPFVSTCKAAFYTLFKSRKLLVAMTVLLSVIFTVQIFVINVNIPPKTKAFALDTKYYRQETGFIRQNSLIEMIKSFIMAFGSSSAIMAMQVILIHTYKVMSDY